ncbi:hypothetical protein BJ741DRAFT_605811, partial [Chytriomyces cf. hyalinus JEL632]
MTLPTTRQQVSDLVETLSARERMSFAAKIVVQHRETNLTQLRALIGTLIETTNALPRTVPVQADTAKTTDAIDTDWDVLASASSIELTTPQTDACLNLHTRGVGIYMAVALKDEELLERILQHPSQSFKEKVRDTLNAIRQQKRKLQSATDLKPKNESEIAMAKFTAFFDSIKAAPSHRLPIDNATRTRTQAWEEYSKKSWDLPWENGSLTSVSDKQLRKSIADAMLECFTESPPITITKATNPDRDVHVPIMTKLFSRNLKELFKLCPQATIAAICTLITPHTKLIEANVLGPIFKQRLNLWSRHGDGEFLVELIKPVLEKLDIALKRRVIHSTSLSVILSAKPLKAVVFFLLQKCLFQTKLVVEKYISQRDIFHNDPNRLRVTDSYISDIESGCASIVLIIRNLSERALGISEVEARLASQRAYEKDAMKAIDDLLSVFGAAMDALPGHTEALMKQYVERKDNYKRAWIVRPLLDLFLAHPLLANHMYEATVSDFRLEMYKPLTKTVLRHLAPANTTVFDFPEHDIVAPYSGIQRDPAWNANAFAYFYALFPPVESSVYWVSVAPYLTHENLNLLKGAFGIADLVKFDAPHLMNVLDKLFVNVRERCEMAWKLMDAVKELRADLPSRQIDEYMSMLRQRLDVRVPEARELLEKNLKQSTIEKRVEAIRDLLTSSNLAESVDETMATLTVLLPKLKNEMRLNMDQIFRLIETKVNVTFYEGYTIEQAKSLAAVYEALDEHNLAAVSISPFAQQFVSGLATKMLGFYIGTPSHPFFEFALNVFWRHEVQIRGSSSSIHTSFPFKNPDNSQRQEYLEFDRRKAYTRGIELHKELDPTIDLEDNEDSMFGLFRIPEGKEEAVVAHIVEHVRLKYDAIIPKKTAFMDSNCGRTLFADLKKCLGLRWSKSNTLVTYYESCLAALKNAPLLNDGAEPILNWAEFQNSGVLTFVTQCVQFSPKSEGARWMNLRLKSNLAAEIARDLFNGCKGAVEKDALVVRLFELSPSGSALHIHGILRHVILRLPRLFEAEHISERRVFWGLFHPGMDTESNNSSDLLKFSVSNLSENPLPKNVLLKWQEELMVERYWAEALDATLPMNERVLSATRMMHMRCFSINKAAAFLVTDSLPSRVKEAVLMFLPKLDEPACAVNLLLAPAYLQSDLARTAIYAVQNVLRYFKDDEVTRIFENLVPQEAQTGGVKVGVFKEIVRLLGQYCRIPRILALFESLWGRKKLNMDVRIAHLQQSMTLLKSNEPAVADAAWKLVLDAVHGKWFLDVSAVLVMVMVEGSVYQQLTEMTINGVGYGHYSFGTITARPLPRNLASRYAAEVIAPTALRLYNRMKTMSKNDKNYGDFTTRTIYAFSILYHKFFIDEQNAGAFSQLFAGVSEEAATASPDDVIATAVFKWMMPILGICSGLLAAANPTVIPHSWEQFSKCTRLIAHTILDANSTPTERSVAVAKLDSLALGTCYFPKVYTEDHALLQAALLPIEQMETVPGGAKFFAALRLARETAWLKANVIVFVRASQPIQERKFLIDLAEKTIITMLRFGFEKREYGVLDLTGKEYDNKFKELCQTCEPLIGFHNRMKEIYESDSWCSDLAGFNAYRSQFRLALLNSALNLKDATSVSKYVEMLVKTDDSLLEEIHGQLATMIVQYLRECQESLRELNAWKRQPSYRQKPRHDQSGQNALISLMTELYRRIDSESEFQSSAGFKLLESVVTSCAVFLLEQLPGLTAQFIRNFATSAMEDDWFLHLEQAFMKRDMTVVENADTGIEAIRLLIERIVSGAQATGFDDTNKSKKMDRFKEVFRRTPAIVLHIAPEVAAYVAQHPTGAVGDAVLILIKSLYRTETVSMYLQVVFDGRVGEVDLAKLVSLQKVREGDESKFFEMHAEVADSSFNLSASNSRSRSTSLSIAQVAQRFVDHQMMNGSPAFARYLNAAANDAVIVSESSFVNSIPRLGHGGYKRLNERVEIIKFIRRHMTAEVAVLNPYLYFECMISSLSLERVHPFISPSMMEVIRIQSLISVDSSLTKTSGFVRMAVPIRYILDIASALVFKIAPYCDEQGKHRIANEVRHNAMAILQTIQMRTSNSCFARKSRKAVTAIDLLVLEAARPGDVEGEMVVTEYQELVKALLLMGDRKLFDASCELQNSPWQLKWTDAELTDK